VKMGSSSSLPTPLASNQYRPSTHTPHQKSHRKGGKGDSIPSAQSVMGLSYTARYLGEDGEEERGKVGFDSSVEALSGVAGLSDAVVSS
jgi:hypothetical protein